MTTLNISYSRLCKAISSSDPILHGVDLVVSQEWGYWDYRSIKTGKILATAVEVVNFGRKGFQLEIGPRCFIIGVYKTLDECERAVRVHYVMNDD